MVYEFQISENFYLVKVTKFLNSVIQKCHMGAGEEDWWGKNAPDLSW